MSRDDWYRRDEQRRDDMRAEERRQEWRRQDMLRDERRREAQRDERRREERRQEERRQEAMRDEERRRQRAADEKAQAENRARGMSLLRDGYTDWGAAVLGLDPDRIRRAPGDPPASGRSAAHEPADPVSHPAPARATPQPLPAPVLTRFDDIFTGTTSLGWTAVPGAAEYVLEESLGPTFVLTTEIYRGERTEHVLDDGLGTGVPSIRLRSTLATSAFRRSYRAKALAGPGFLDSPWSNTA